jgi:threonyl-tRNA synthetase
MGGRKTYLEVLKEKGVKNAVAVKLGENLLDLTAEVSEGDKEVEWIDLNSPLGLEIYRHSAAHIMAAAVKNLFPKTKLGIGPVIENGFYYDFDLEKSLSLDDFPKIEKEMKRLIKKNLPFQREVLSREDAIKLFSSLGEVYKVELLKEMEEEKVSIYRLGDFVDLCRGPHLPSSGYLKAFKLISLAGAYWRGDEKRPMLQRIYGTAFPTKEELEGYLKRLEEAEKRDHRKLGKQLELFSFHEEAGAGLVFYHPKGAVLRFILEEFIKREHQKRGYQFVITPHIMKGDLWRISGHYDFYRENMYFFEIEEKEYAVKPMNCPGHILIYNTRPRSYKEFPLRFFELGTVYRYERSGVLHGLLRVRGFTQDDAHIFCTPEQLEEEIGRVLEFAFYTLRTFGFEEFEVKLSTRPEHYAGTLEIWKHATEALENALKNENVEYEIDPGEGVFYGPKIDIKLKDALGRLWQATTIQVDFNIPERFELVYWGPDNKQHRPVMIHRAILGSLERFLGALIEHHAGSFPFWVSPIQVVVIPIADRHEEYANEVRMKLEEEGFRVIVDLRSESVSKKIRDAEVEKIPYMLIVGDREVKEKKVAVRERKEGDKGARSFSSLIEELNKASEGKKIPFTLNF